MPNTVKTHSPAQRLEGQQADKPFHHTITNYHSHNLGRLQERQNSRERRESVLWTHKFATTVLCIHLVGKYFTVCFSNKGVWAISGMTKHNLTPCQAQHSAINLICFSTLPDCFAACLQGKQLNRETCRNLPCWPLGQIKDRDKAILHLWNSSLILLNRL